MAPLGQLEQRGVRARTLLAQLREKLMMMGKQLTSSHLRRLFQTFNETYFNGRLPDYHVALVDRITKLGESGRILRRRRLIQICSGQTEEETIGVLLHEMVHAATVDGHGPRWRAEMRRLQGEGAALTASDRNVDDDPEEPLTKATFENLAADALIYDPRLSLKALATGIVRGYGYADSPTAFLRRYWWARSAFAEVKKEARQHAKCKQRALAQIRHRGKHSVALKG